MFYVASVSIVAPSVTVTPTQINAFTLTKVVVTCKSTGNPKPSITWKRAFRKMPSNSYTKHNGTLVIENITKGDSGSYQCSAQNLIGHANGVITIWVKGRQNFASFISNI